MDIEQLKNVLALARYKNFTETSYEIALSQPALSKHLGKIENELGGVRLFDRTTRPIKLTDAGEKFIDYAQRIVEEFEALKLAVREYSLLSQGHLVVGSIPVMGRLGLTALIVAFKKEYSNINIEIKERQNKELLELLKRAELDLAFITAPVPSVSIHPSITCYPFMEDDIVLVTNKLNPLAKQTAIDLVDTENEVFFLLDSDSGMYQICMESFKKAGVMPAKIHESRNVETIIGLVTEGLGVTLLTWRLARSFIMSKITMVRLNNPFQRTTALAVRNQPHIAAPVKTFTKFALAWKSSLRQPPLVNSKKRSNKKRPARCQELPRGK